MPANPPDGLPRYRLITGKDDAAFCRRISEILAQGYELHGSPSLTYDPQQQCVIAGQAVLWPVHQPQAPVK
ncbi:MULTISPECIES: DUF1737 domain-containing protein [unclassified Pseudomonas]|uniref:DUF1737 domain-containing protein n=1 Tax=unclassified Pseudomonas TaxID=196821 RepID=UPI00380E3637